MTDATSMSVCDRPRERGRSGSLYGSLAYGTVVLTCYAGFFPQQRGYYSDEWMVLVVFALGGLYSALGVLCGIHADYSGRLAKLTYYLLQVAILTTILVLSPVRGFVGILVLPLFSQAIFDLQPAYAVLVGSYLFGMNVVIATSGHGWNGAWEAMLDYATAFAFTGVFTVITKQAVTARKREQALREEVEAANRQLRDYAVQAEALATARERNRLAREIHDGVGHYLTVVKTQLDAAAALLPAQPDRAREAVAKAARLTGDALDDVRRSVGALRTDTTLLPLPEALRAVAREAGLPVTVRVEGEARPLEPGVEHALFRSAQEALTNVRKHAGASVAEVALDFRAQGSVRLAVTDNGKGSAGASSSGFGLRGIRERVELLGGRVEAGDQAGGGFALRVEVPA